MSKPETKGKYSRLSAYLYLAMALLIVAVAAFSIFALNRSIPEVDYSQPDVSFALPPTTDFSVPSTPDVSLPSLTPDVSLPHVPDHPVINEQSGVEDTSSDSPADAEKPSAVCPIADGRVLKSCSLDALVFSETMRDYRVHTGLDLVAAVGTEVQCYDAGTVESVQDDAFLGRTVTVRHGYGLVTVYANLDPSAETVAVGAELAAGDRIGAVGASAIVESAEEPHLHFEMLLNGDRIDPERELFG